MAAGKSSISWQFGGLMEEASKAHHGQDLSGRGNQLFQAQPDVRRPFKACGSTKAAPKKQQKWMEANQTVGVLKNAPAEVLDRFQCPNHGLEYASTSLNGKGPQILGTEAKNSRAGGKLHEALKQTKKKKKKKKRVVESESESESE